MVEQIEAFQSQQRSSGPEALRRQSANRPTSCVPVPRKADFAITLPSTTGRSLLAPSPLLSMPVVALNGRADANCVSVPTVTLYGKRVAGRDDRAMPLIDDARAALLLAEARDVRVARRRCRCRQAPSYWSPSTACS